VEDFVVDFAKAVILAIIQGVTEFLPISSTGHLIIVEDYLQLGAKDFADAFMVIIQLPSILAVALFFWKTLWPFGKDTDTPATIQLWGKILLAVVPALVIGKLFGKAIKLHLYNPVTVSITLILGGIVLIAVERLLRRSRYETAQDLPVPRGIAVGFIQCIAMIPGVSRSAATIIGGRMLGASRAAAAEFSFFLAIPTMCAATGYEVLESFKHHQGGGWTCHEWALILVACAVSFVVSYAVVAWLMNFIKRHSFEGFGYYRIALGVLVLALKFAHVLP
jgi:undecaprenyl-diphosphatase